MNAYALIAALPAYVGSPYVFWHDKGEPYRNASSNFANNVVNTCATRAKDEGVSFTRSASTICATGTRSILEAGWGRFTISSSGSPRSLTTTEIFLRAGS